MIPTGRFFLLVEIPIMIIIQDFIGNRQDSILVFACIGVQTGALTVVAFIGRSKCLVKFLQ